MMLPNSTAPAPGANSVCPSNLWQIYMLRGQQWVPVGTMCNRALAETHLASLRKMMRRNQFQLVWEGAIDA